MKTLALIGRPNVGKSTLYNRLTGTKHALVHDLPGVTRDRREGSGSLGPLRFTVVDTAGLVDGETDALTKRMTAQSLAALETADAIALVIDGRAGLLPDDRHFADLVRKSGRPVILVVNKCERGMNQVAREAYALGFGEPVAISAEHGEGLADLYEALAPYLDEEEDEQDEAAGSRMHIAIVGRPNAGKSTLFNRLLGEERVLTGPEAGLTRDAIAVDTEIDGVPLRLVDTAGMRRRANVTGALEKLAVQDAVRVIRFAQVVVLLLDGATPLEKQEATIADLVIREGRALVIAVNKIDTIKTRKALLDELSHRLEHMLPQVKGVPVLAISAKSGEGVGGLIRAAQKQVERWQARVPTGELNRWLAVATERHPPPLVEGRTLKLRYVTQVKSRPPTFAFFSARADHIPDHYQRYLTNSLREAFGLAGVPLRLILRKPKNPYV